jgi:hypothetical protein
MADKTYQTTLLIRGDSKDAVRQVQLTREQLEQLTGVQKKNAAQADQLSASHRSLGSAYKVAATGLAALGISVGIAAGLRKVYEETAESEAAIAQLNATLKSTGGAAGLTSEQLIKTANALQATTTYSDEAVLGAQSLLLTIKDIKSDNFDRTTQAVLDMSTALKTDLKSSALLAGKALNDPVKGLSALSQSGIQFTADQKETIKALVEMGDKAGAQTIILKELESQFGGSAAAARDTLGGALEALKNSFGELFELDSAESGKITASINDLNRSISDPQFKAGIDNLVAGLLSVVSASAQALGGLTSLGEKLGQFAASYRDGVDSTAEGVARLRQEIAVAKQDLERFEQRGGNKDTFAYKSLVDDVERLTASLLLSEVAIGQQKTSAKEASVALNGYVNELADGALSANQFAAAGVKATGTQEKFSLVVNKSTTATKAGTKATQESTVAGLKSEATLKKEAAATEKLAKEKAAVQDRIKRVNAEFERGHDILDGLTRGTREHIDALKFETSQLGLSERQQFINNELRKEGTAITRAERAELIAVAGAHYDAAKAAGDLAQASQDAAQASEQAWSDARATLSNFFFEMAADGEGAFDTLVEGFRAMVVKMAAEAAANTIILGVSTAFPGLGSFVGGATAPGTGATSGGSTLLSGGISGLAGGLTSGGQALYESIGNLSSNAGFTGFGDKAYTKGLNTTGWTMAADIGGGLAGGFLGSKVFGETSGIGASLGGIAGSIAIPIPGLGAAIGSFIGSGLEKAADKLFGQKNDGNNAAGANFNLLTGAIDPKTWGNSFDQKNVDAATQLATVLKDFSDALGGSDLQSSITVGNKDGIRYGGQSFGTDTEAFFEEAFRDVIEASTKLDDRLKPLLLRMDGTAEEIGTLAATLLALDEQADGLSERTLALIANYTGAADQTARYAAAIASIDQQAGINTVTKAIEEFTAVTPSAQAAYATHTASLREQIRNFDGSALAAENLAQSLLENKAAAYDFAMAIQSIGKAIGDMASEQAQSIRESVLSAEQLRKKRTEERDALRKELSTLGDPQLVQETSKRILELNKQIFDSLSEDRQKVEAETFASIAETTSTVAKGILQQNLDGLKIMQDDVQARLAQMLDRAAQGQRAAANTQQSAAATAQQAANTLLTAAQKFSSGVDQRAGQEVA